MVNEKVAGNAARELAGNDHQTAQLDYKLVENEIGNFSTIRIIIIFIFTLAAAVFSTDLDLERFPIQGSDEVSHLVNALGDEGINWNIYAMPLHTLTYTLTELLESDPIRIYQLNAFVPFFAMVFLLQTLVLRHTGSVALSVLAAAPLLLSPSLGLLAWPHANQTTCIIFLTGLLLMPRGPTYGAVVAHALLLFFLIGFARSEQVLSLYFAVVAIAASSLIWGLRGQGAGLWLRQIGLPFLVTITSIAALSTVMSPPILQDKYRSLSAFSQHYAYGLSLRTDVQEHPWLESDAVFAASFGDTSSISGALFENPAHFLDHVFFNIFHLFASLGADPVGYASWLLALCLFFIVTLGLVRNLSARSRDGGLAPMELGRLLLFFAPVPSLILILLIFPRPNYLQMSYVMLVATTFVLLGDGTIRTLVKRVEREGLPMLLAAGTLALVIPMPERPDPFRAVVEILRDRVSEHTQPTLRIAATQQICVFLERECANIRLRHTREDLVATLGREDVDFIVLVKHPERPDLQEDLDPVLAARADIGDGRAWIELPAPDGWHLLIRNETADTGTFRQP